MSRCRRQHQKTCEGPVTESLCAKHRATWEAMQADWGRRAREAAATIVPGVTHCHRGHPFNETNTLWQGGRRACRECRNRRTREYRARAAAKERDDIRKRRVRAWLAESPRPNPATKTTQKETP